MNNKDNGMLKSDLKQLEKLLKKYINFVEQLPPMKANGEVVLEDLELLLAHGIEEK